jgi:hypothetical protein
MQSEPQHKKTRLQVFLWSAGLFYIIEVVRLRYIGWSKYHPHTELLPLARAAEVAVPTALLGALLMCLVWPKR